MNLENLRKTHPELRILDDKIKKLILNRKSKKDLDKAVLLYLKRVIEIAELDDFDEESENRDELIEDMYLLSFSLVEDDNFPIVSEKVMKVFYSLQGLKSLTKASRLVEKALEEY